MPRDLAIALTLLEGDRYKAILPTDYIAHLKKQARPNNVEAAYLANNKIVLWVKQSVLHYDTIDSRAQVLKFFVNTALVGLATKFTTLSNTMIRNVENIATFPQQLQSQMHYILPQSTVCGLPRENFRNL